MNLRTALQEIEALSTLDPSKLEKMLSSLPGLRDAGEVLLAHQGAQAQAAAMVVI